MKNAVANLPTEQFPQPPGITTIKIHKSGRSATGACTQNRLNIDKNRQNVLILCLKPPNYL